MDNDTYTIIPDSFLDLDLTLAETVILATIHGFCQDGESDFHGSYSYLARKAKVTRSWAIKMVGRLVSLGLVKKDVREVGGVKSTSIRTTLGGGVLTTPLVYSLHRGGVLTTPGGGVLTTPNNKVLDNKKKINITPISPFDFLKALKGLGVPDDLARDWMAVRKTKRATNTATAFDRIKAEIGKSGRPAADCVRLAVENSWSGFKADWMPKAPERRESWEEFKRNHGLQ